jgi:serine/threonine-protein kinase
MRSVIRPPRPKGPPLGQRLGAWLNARPRLKYTLYVLAGGFLLGYLFITLLFFPGFGRAAVVTVPDVRGMSLMSARRAMDRVGLDAARSSSLPNARLAAGRVLTQVPLPGQEAARGSVVRVILSEGPDRRPIPSIEGLEKDDAIALLQRMGFQVRLRLQQDMREEGSVLAMQPTAGTAVPMPGVVVLTLSSGPPKVAAPSLLQGTLEQATERLEAAGLRLGRVLYDSTSTAPLGDVVGQSPAAGDSIRQGGSVRVTLSGRDPTPPPPVVVDTVTVPPGEEPPAEPEPPPPPAP